jgi:hypothetical protein
MFKIGKVNRESTKIEQCKNSVLGVIPKHPFRMYIVGCSGSGKTNLTIWLLTKKDYYKQYFDKIFIISPTAGKLDKTYDVLKDEDYTDGKDMLFLPVEIEALQIILDLQEQNDKKDKVLVIMDDCISFGKFMRSNELLQFAIMSRHFNISVMLLSQAYHAVPKSIRINMSCIIYFKGSNKENKIICEDTTPAGFNERGYMEKINEATENPYDFLFVDFNTPLHGKVPRYRKNLTGKLL